MTKKQRQFVEEYLLDGNATQAAKRCGYSERSAHIQGTTLLKRPEIKAAIDAGRAALAKETRVSKEWVVKRAIEAYKQACELNQMAAARATLDLLARLHGHIVEKRETRVINDVEQLSDEELAALELSLRRKAEAEKGKPN
jgi:phage terminase small subunit